MIEKQNSLLLRHHQKQEKQRILIARTILKNPKILILDEATSSLDSESEVIVQHALEELSKDRTTIVIAHRLTTVQNVDIVFVFDKGEIVASGNFNDLVATNDIVSRFVELSNLEITD